MRCSIFNWHALGVPKNQMNCFLQDGSVEVRQGDATFSYKLKDTGLYLCHTRSSPYPDNAESEWQR
jgi:hypothetical protein